MATKFDATTKFSDPEVDAMAYFECGQTSAPFMRFWSAVNDQLVSRGKPAIMYGEAKQRWNAAAEEDWI